MTIKPNNQKEISNTNMHSTKSGVTQAFQVVWLTPLPVSHTVHWKSDFNVLSTVHTMYSRS